MPQTDSSSTQENQPAPAEAQSLTADQQKIAAAIAKTNASEPELKPTPRFKALRPATEPPKEVLDKELTLDIDLDEGPTVTNAEPTTVRMDSDGDKKIEPSPKVEPKAEPKVEVQKPKVEEKKEEKPTVVTQAEQVKVGDVARRDYSGFSAEEAAALKQMSNAGFQLASRALKENKELKAQRNDVFLQHPNAYMLAPEYGETQNLLARVDFEANHYKQQLMKLRRGEQWTVFQGFDKDGNPVFSEPMAATEEADIEISNALQMLLGRAAESRNKLQTLQIDFSKRYNGSVEAVNAERAKRFEWVADPAKLEEKIDVGGKLGEVPIKQIISDFKSIFPPHMHGSPLLDVSADLFVSLQILGARNRELESAVATEKKLKEHVAAAEPVLESSQGGKKEEPELVFDTKGMEGL